MVADSAQMWLKKKADFDSKAGGGDGSLWMVHGKWYDLESYIERHPGGRDWLLYTRGQDITEMFETHHFNRTKVELILRGFYVKDADPSYQPLYDWAPDGLFRTLQRRVWEKLGKDSRNTNATRTFLVQCYMAVFAHAALFCAACYCQSVVLIFAAGVLLPTMYGIGHNFLHQRDSWLMYASALTVWKPHSARVTHVLSHHHFPNIDTEGGTYPEALDMELVSTEPWAIHVTSRADQNPWFAWAVVIPALVSLWVKDPVIMAVNFLRGVYGLRLQYAITLIQVSMLVASCGLVKGVAFWLMMTCYHGLVDGLSGFALHRSKGAWMEGDSDRKRDYAEHCVNAVVDTGLDHGLLTAMLFHELLTDHAIHHCFPTLDHSRLKEVRPVFEETLKEFGVEHKIREFPEHFTSMWVRWTVSGRESMKAPLL